MQFLVIFIKRQYNFNDSLILFQHRKEDSTMHHICVGLYSPNNAYLYMNDDGDECDDEVVANDATIDGHKRYDNGNDLPEHVPAPIRFAVWI